VGHGPFDDRPDLRIEPVEVDPARKQAVSAGGTGTFHQVALPTGRDGLLEPVSATVDVEPNRPGQSLHVLCFEEESVFVGAQRKQDRDLGLRDGFGGRLPITRRVWRGLVRPGERAVDLRSHGGHEEVGKLHDPLPVLLLACQDIQKNEGLARTVHVVDGIHIAPCRSHVVPLVGAVDDAVVGLEFRQRLLGSGEKSGGTGTVESLELLVLGNDPAEAGHGIADAPRMGQHAGVRILQMPARAPRA